MKQGLFTGIILFLVHVSNAQLNVLSHDVLKHYISTEVVGYTEVGPLEKMSTWMELLIPMQPFNTKIHREIISVSPCWITLMQKIYITLHWLCGKQAAI
jgi:hypothetical protein